MDDQVRDIAPEELAALIESAEARAQASYFLCAPQTFARQFRLEVRRIGSLWVTMLPALDHPLFNRIVGLGVGQPATESMLDEAIGVLQQAGCRHYLAQVSPLARPPQCLAWLAARGFKPGRNWAKVYRGNEPAPVVPCDLRVEIIGAEQAEAYAGVVLSAFDMPFFLRPFVTGPVGRPGWHHCLAFDGNKPVSAAALFVEGGVGWYGDAGTSKSHRKRGGQSAVLARLIEAGRQSGCKRFVAETGEDEPEDPNPSYHNVLRAGFTLAYLRRNYVHQPPAGPLHIHDWRRALFVASYSLSYGLRRLSQR